MKFAFINTKENSLDFTNINYDRYNLETLIKACDSPYVTLSDKKDDIVVDTVSFIVRTFKNNLLVHCHKTDKVVFEAFTNDNLPNGITLNDFMLVKAKQLLTTLYTSYNIKEIATSAFPVPFGIIKRVNDTKEALFQIVVNHEILKNLGGDYEYSPVENFKNSVDFNKAYQQFKFTKGE